MTQKKFNTVELERKIIVVNLLQQNIIVNNWLKLSCSIVQFDNLSIKSSSALKTGYKYSECHKILRKSPLPLGIIAYVV